MIRFPDLMVNQDAIGPETPNRARRFAAHIYIVIRYIVLGSGIHCLRCVIIIY
jgi:hypothetical protein